MRFPMLGALAPLLAATPAAAQEVTECDRLAANPFDPQRVVETGVSFASLVPLAEAAIAACRAAVEADPGNQRLGYQLGRSLDAGDQSEEAVALYRGLADAGYGMAMNALGRAYVMGTGVAADPMAAIPLYERAVESGVYSAAANLGDIYSDGQPAPDDDLAIAFTWYLKAAESDYVYALEKVGFFHATGRGTPIDYDEAFRWLERAYGMGSGNAAKNLAVMYESGYAVEVDFQRAGELYFEAVERGDASALDTYSTYALASHPEVWRAAERLLGERGLATVPVDGVPDRDTLIALAGMVPAADTNRALKAFNDAMASRVTPRP